MSCKHKKTKILFHDYYGGKIHTITDEKLICKKCRMVFQIQEKEVDLF